MTLEVLQTSEVDHGGDVASHGPLPFIVLSATGEDVRRCTSCWGCEAITVPEMDLSFGELMQGVARNDERVLGCATLWACEALAARTVCQQGLQVASVLEALRQEARRRGVTPRLPVERPSA
ncbi:MAG: hypothetical protein MUO35_12120 [Anaerolineales bacterium]|nr:hypothetical protein [Anaerolineales bacterium]